MDNEIKEILDILNRMAKENKESDNPLQSTVILFEILYKVLNYITNLQQENKEWGMIFDTFSSRPYAHKYLEEKRKELGNDKIIGLDSEMIYKDYYDYKSRCEKASDKIQYIIDYGFDYDGFNTVESLKGLIDMLVDYARESKNILQNGSDSQ